MIEYNQFEINVGVELTVDYPAPVATLNELGKEGWIAIQCEKKFIEKIHEGNTVPTMTVVFHVLMYRHKVVNAVGDLATKVLEKNKMKRKK